MPSDLAAAVQEAMKDPEIVNILQDPVRFTPASGMHK
jgi:hypothetical protein